MNKIILALGLVFGILMIAGGLQFLFHSDSTPAIIEAQEQESVMSEVRGEQAIAGEMVRKGYYLVEFEDGTSEWMSPEEFEQYIDEISEESKVELQRMIAEMDTQQLEYDSYLENVNPQLYEWDNRKWE